MIKITNGGRTILGVVVCLEHARDSLRMTSAEQPNNNNNNNKSARERVHALAGRSAR